ncbi:MAG: hypothetical protein EP344_09465 [Bacteroidetes bacterium]|nr:MAG: hypothetical protein EP344_09465 [Bacteroidota bacterium]
MTCFSTIHRLYHTCFWIFLLAGLLTCSRETKPVKYVAYVGFDFHNEQESAKRNYSEQLHASMIKGYLKGLSKGKYHVRLDTLIYDCPFLEDSARIRAIYRDIASNPDIILVVDNTWGKHIQHAQPIIRDQGIPVIALNADQNKLDYNGNALFLSPNDPQPMYMVRFIKEALKVNSVGFITEFDYKPHQIFTDLLDSNQIRYNTIASLSQYDYRNNNQVDRSDSLALIRSLERNLRTSTDSVILLNTHAGYGRIVFQYLKENDIPGKVLIGFLQSIVVDPAELEAISMKGHTIIQLENENETFPIELYRRQQQFRQYLPPEYFTHKNTDNYLWRCYDATNILEKSLRKGVRSREGLVEFFRELRNRKIAERNQLYEFDSSHILIKTPMFNQISRGKWRSCPVQINSRGMAIPNLRVGLDIIDINEIDVRNNSFSCNMLYWVIADSNYIDKEDYIGFENMSTNEAERDAVASRVEDNFVVRIYRISGKFYSNYETFDFPFDKHQITIPISALSTSDEMKISFDFSRLLGKVKKDSFKFIDWATNDYFVTIDNQLTSRLGSLDKITIDTNDTDRYLEKYKLLNVRLEVSRRPWGAITLIILPFMMFSILPIFMLFFQKVSFDEVGELIITSFLAAVAYSINLTQLSPTTDSMNRAYLFLLLTLGVNFLCFLYVTYSDRRFPALEEKFMQTVRIYVPYVILMLYIILSYFIFVGV